MPGSGSKEDLRGSQEGGENGMAEAIGEYGLNVNVEDDDERVPVNEEPVVAVVLGDGKKLKSTPTFTNTYAAKKTVAQGMMDIALITANANQLRYLIEYGSESKTYYLSVVLITLSLLIQVAVGISLIFKGRYDLTGQQKHEKALMLNNVVVVGVFVVTIINVFVASFSLTGDGNSAMRPAVTHPPPVYNPAAAVADPV